MTHSYTLLAKTFPQGVSLNRFVELMPWCLMTLCYYYLHTCTGKVIGISVIDLTPLEVCHRCRAHAHKVFEEKVAWGKNSLRLVLWF